MFTRWTIPWFLCPVALLAFHWGPGQKWQQRDAAAQQAHAADRSFARSDFQSAAAGFALAAAKLPPDEVEQRRALDVARGRALVRAGEVVEGQGLLEKTLRELEASGVGNSPLGIAARHELATSSYYAALVMRLEGGTPDDWKPEAERARQQFRLLAETQGLPPDRAAGVSQPHVNEAATELVAAASQLNLEATIQLEHMDLSELLARPLPKNCPKCKQNLCQRKRKQCSNQCNNQGDPKRQPSQPKREEENARQEIKKSNSAGVYAGGGSGS